MSSDEWVALTRDCPAVAIPGGHPLALHKGSRVRIRQTLGGRFVVATSLGMLVRIDGSDADALNLEVSAADALPAPSRDTPSGPVEQRVWSELRTCFDPEIPVSIVELGLVYGLNVAPLEGGAYDLDIELTLTAPGCGMGEVLKREIEQKVIALPGVRCATVRLVFDPPWDRSRMTEAARLQLGL